ncbi:hypothetical protein ERJ75_001352000 [Trypanosoma vivax]|uniref:Uncharacterized protein n=1 Tax=Trypanosoma vivax (strain Y486) TaxID=1055687 RepID=G0UCY4_TRYVY|nr:hypothetical protein TRVL_07092 [Trypanosoma vivax]KAH8607959.1 hypothetical protein ERJ75_001352000 [Trypanosoma vivax]CCC53694.1 conserved hypothetical protein [Trypanosoma vivax Y486]
MVYSTRVVRTSVLNVESLNTGLTRVASVKRYPKTQPTPQKLTRSTKGRVFRIGMLHNKEMTEAMLMKNRRGFINSQVNTVAHAPSLYHWLFHRCGVPFEEAQELASSSSLMVDGTVVDRSELVTQRDWAELQRRDIRIRVDHIAMGKPTVSTTPTVANSETPWVPVLKRALHRKYFFIYLHPGVSITSDQTDPRSFVHRLAPTIGSTSALGMNILRPIGFMNGMKGLGLATNDVSMVRYWNNEFLGNYGVYDIRFQRGIPPEALHRLAADVNGDLDAGIRRQLSKDVKVPCSCTVQPVPTRTDGAKQLRHRDVVVELYSQALHHERLVLSTPLLPYRVAQKIRRAGGLTTLVRSGPFILPPSLPQTKVRPLSPQELALMFTFERRLKTNRVILSLREFEADADEGTDEMPFLQKQIV